MKIPKIRDLLRLRKSSEAGEQKQEEKSAPEQKESGAKILPDPSPAIYALQQLQNLVTGSDEEKEILQKHLQNIENYLREISEYFRKQEKEKGMVRGKTLGPMDLIKNALGTFLLGFMGKGPLSSLFRSTGRIALSLLGEVLGIPLNLMLSPLRMLLSPAFHLLKFLSPLLLKGGAKLLSPLMKIPAVSRGVEAGGALLGTLGKMTRAGGRVLGRALPIGALAFLLTDVGGAISRQFSEGKGNLFDKLVKGSLSGLMTTASFGLISGDTADKITEIVYDLAKGLFNLTFQLLRSGLDLLWKAISGAIKKRWDSFVQSIEDIASGIHDAISGVIEGAIDKVHSLFRSLGELIKNKLGPIYSLWEWAKNQIDKLKGTGGKPQTLTYVPGTLPAPYQQELGAIPSLGNASPPTEKKDRRNILEYLAALSNPIEMARLFIRWLAPKDQKPQGEAGGGAPYSELTSKTPTLWKPISSPSVPIQQTISRPIVTPAPGEKFTPVSLPVFGNERLAPGELIPKDLTPQDKALLQSVEAQVKGLRHPQSEKIKHYLWWMNKYVFQTSKPHPVTQLTKENPFRMGYDGRGHLGTDFATPEGTPIYAPFEGYVILKDTGRKGWGKHIILVNKNNAILFGHLQGFNPDLKSGQAITRGTFLGWTGKSGNVWSRSGGSGAHLDVTVFQINDEGSSFKMVPIQDYSYLTSTLQAASTTPILSNEVHRRYTELITNRLLRSGGVVLSREAISESPYQSVIDKATAQSAQGQISAENAPLSSTESILNWLQEFWSSESGQKLSQGVLQETQKYFSSLPAPSSSSTPSGSASKAPAQSAPAQTAPTFSYQPYIQGSTVTFSLASPDGGGGGGLFDLISTGIKAISNPQDFFRNLGERATSVLTNPEFLDMATKAITDPKSFSVEGMAKHIIERSVSDYEVSSLLVDLVSGKKPEELLPKYGAIFRNKSIEEAVSSLEQGLDTAINKAKELSGNNPIFSGVLNWLRSKASEWIRSVANSLKRNPDLTGSQAKDTQGAIDFISPASGSAGAPSETIEFTKPGEESGSRDTQEVDFIQSVQESPSTGEAIDFIQPAPESTTPSQEIDFIQPAPESTSPAQEIDFIQPTPESTTPSQEIDFIQPAPEAQNLGEEIDFIQPAPEAQNLGEEIDFIQPEGSDLDYEAIDLISPSISPPSSPSSIESSLKSMSISPRPISALKVQQPPAPLPERDFIPPPESAMGTSPVQTPPMVMSSPAPSPGGRSESTFSEELLILLNTIFRV